MAAKHNLELVEQLQQTTRYQEYDRLGRPYSTYECVVYRIANGKVAESTTYISWLDPDVRVGLVDMDARTR